jgi:hypothetical protein
MDDADEIARMLRLLDEHRSHGEYVLESARMVGDEEDHAIWRQSRKLWAAAAVAALERCAVAVDLQSSRIPAELRCVDSDLRSIADASETMRRRVPVPRAGHHDAAGPGFRPGSRRGVRVPPCGRTRMTWSSAGT